MLTFRFSPLAFLHEIRRFEIINQYFYLYDGKQTEIVIILKKLWYKVTFLLSHPLEKTFK